ncbi:hypothetical protein OIO90_006260 [Microbotryomycetes sp. JL221]|nr:hypothetical protein OIO90_006260 [Microbotryomycetes sp. JL221]
MPRHVKIAVCQFAPGSLDDDATTPQSNLERALDYVKQAAQQGANVICFPEYFLTGIMADPKHHHLGQPTHKHVVASSSRHEHRPRNSNDEPERQTWLNSFRQMARELSIDIVAGTIIERGTEESSLHNVSHYIEGTTGNIIGRYDKVNLWHPEKNYLSPGQERHIVFETSYGRVGILVCWDLAWSESFRQLLLQNVDVVFAPTCWLGSDGADVGLAHNPKCEETYLDSLIVSRAFENECVVVLANCGGQYKDGWIGRSRVAVPFKGSVAEAKSEQEQLFIADVDLDILKTFAFLTRAMTSETTQGYDTHLVLKFERFSQLKKLAPRAYTAAIAQASAQTRQSLLVLVRFDDRGKSPWSQGATSGNNGTSSVGSSSTVSSSVTGNSSSATDIDTPVEAWSTLERFLAQCYSAATKVFMEQMKLTSKVDVVIEDLRGGLPFCIPNGVDAIQHRVEHESQHYAKQIGSVDRTSSQLMQRARGSYEVTALGGTFDHLHAGHKILLTMSASVTTRRLITGVTDEALLGKKQYREFLESLDDRISKCRSFLELVRPTVQHDVVAIQDPFGPTAYDPEVQALVVSEETRAGGEAGETLFCSRKEKGLNQLDTLVIKLVADDASTDGGVSAATKLGSTGIRKWLSEQHPRPKNVRSMGKDPGSGLDGFADRAEVGLHSIGSPLESSSRARGRSNYWMEHGRRRDKMSQVSTLEGPSQPPPSVTSSTSIPTTTTVASSDPSAKERMKGFMAGVASGATKLAVGHPFDTVILSLMLQCSTEFKGPLDALQRTIKGEGLRALYKGATPPAVGWAISDATLLGSLHNYRLILARMEARSRGEFVKEDGVTKLSLTGHTIAGVLAGMTASCVICPFEHIKAKLQLQMLGPKLYTGPIDAARQVVQANGVVGLYRGFIATTLFRSWFGAYFLSYEIMQRQFRAVSEDSPWKVSNSTATFLCGGMASNFYWIGAFPFDAVKNRLMADSITNPKYGGIKDVVSAIIVEGGYRNFYRGFLPALLRAFPTNASALLVWETTMRLLGAEQIKS